MQCIADKTFDQERALYGSRGLQVKRCAFDGPADGESAFKECRDIEVERSFFNLRYPFWHDHNLTIRDSEMTELCRAALWYSHDIRIENTKLHGIKALRECSACLLYTSAERLLEAVDGLHGALARKGALVVFARDEDARRAGPQRGLDLGGDAADGQDLPGDADLPGQGGVAIRWPAGDGGIDRNGHGHARRGAVHGHAAGEVDVHVVVVHGKAHAAPVSYTHLDVYKRQWRA